MSAKHKRCNFFDDDGSPRRLINNTQGCPHGSVCRFVHPNDPLWRTLPPSLPPPASLFDPRLHPSRSPPHRPHSRERRATYSPIRSTRRSSPSPSSTRRSSFHNDDGSRISRRTDADSRSRVETSPAIPIQQTMHTSPRPPVTAPPVQPPPPLPSPPNFLSSVNRNDLNNALNAPPKPGLTLEERRQLWHERIRLVSDSAQAHQEHVRLCAELERYHQLTRSSRFPQLSEDDRNSLQKQLADIETRSLAAKKAKENAIERFTETHSWPMTKAHERRGAEYGYKQLVLYIAELRDAITEMHSALKEIIAQRNTSSSASLPKVAPETAMDVDSRPSKRRRMSLGDDGSEPRSRPEQEKHQSDTNDAPSADELECLHDKLNGLESRLSEFENSLTQHDQEIADELNSRMDEKLEELGIEPKPDNLTSTRGPGQIDSPIQENKFEEAEQILNTAGEEIVELAEAVGSLIIQANSHGTEIAQLRQENERLRTECAMIDQKLKECIELQERHKKERAAIMAAFSAHLARPPSPPPSPQIAPIDHILKSTKLSVLQSVRAQVKPMIDELSGNVERMLRASRAEVSETLSGKITDIVRMMDGVSARVDNAKLE